MRFVPPDDLSVHWEFVEKGLDQVLRLTKEPWTPKDIKHAIREGFASLFVCEDGFLVLQRLKAAWTSDPYVNVWVTWFKPGRAKEKRAELIAFLDDATRQSKCDWWEFGSPREGWVGLGECEKVRTIWRRKV